MNGTILPPFFAKGLIGGPNCWEENIGLSWRNRRSQSQRASLTPDESVLTPKTALPKLWHFHKTQSFHVPIGFLKIRPPLRSPLLYPAELWALEWAL